MNGRAPARGGERLDIAARRGATVSRGDHAGERAAVSPRAALLLFWPAGVRQTVSFAARRRAVVRLIARYRDEFDDLVEDELAHPPVDAVGGSWS